MIPTYNEIENISLIIEKLKEIFENDLKSYLYELIIIDNYSTDGTREKIKEICKNEKNIKGILNAKNFGFLNSTFYGLTQSTGDATILMVADFQDPPGLVVDFIKEWEKGYKIVIGLKNRSKESKLMYLIRTIYYKIINKIANMIKNLLKY